MKKTLLSAAFAAGLAGFVAGATFTPQHADAADPDPVAAFLLSAVFPGAGEWYNAGYQGGFPLVECILGNICPCIHIASLIDATAGKTDDKSRIAFWASPN